MVLTVLQVISTNVYDCYPESLYALQLKVTALVCGLESVN